MTRSTSLPLGRMILRYLGVTVLTAVGVAAVYYALGALFALRPSTGGGIAVAIVPAMDAGTTFARRTNRLPGKAEAWKLSCVLFATHVVFGGAVVAALAAATGGTGIAPAIALLQNAGGIGALALIAVVYFLATRFFFGAGAKSEQRRAARVADKGK